MEIAILEQVRPSSLLWTDAVCETAKDLRGACCQYCPEPDPKVLAAWRHQAEALLAQGHGNGCAVVLVCLSDRYRELRDFDAALDCSLKAEWYFCEWADIHHRHNHAVAAYSTGLIYQFKDWDRDALGKYDEALRGFLAAREQWILDGGDRWRRTCDLALGWIKEVRTNLATRWILRLGSRQAEVRARWEPARGRPKPVPLLSLPIAAGEPTLAGADLDGWVDVDPEKAKRAHYVLRVKGDSMIEADISDGDLVLIEQTEAEPPNGQIVVVIIEEMDPEATLKRFYRELDHVRLEPANASYPLIILKPGLVKKADLERRYAKSHPGRDLVFYPKASARIVGWYRDRLPPTAEVY